MFIYTCIALLSCQALYSKHFFLCAEVACVQDLTFSLVCTMSCTCIRNEGFIIYIKNNTSTMTLVNSSNLAATTAGAVYVEGLEIIRSDLRNTIIHCKNRRPKVIL